MLERFEFKTNRKYYIDPNEERQIIWLHPEMITDEHEKRRRLEADLDSFEDGYNTLKTIDGILYEVSWEYIYEIRRKAYL